MKRFYWEWSGPRAKTIKITDRITNTKVAECSDPDIADMIVNGLEEHYAKKDATVA